MRWRKAAILGVGLLGGSLGLALRRRGLAAEVSGLVRRAETAREALALGAVDSAHTQLKPAVEGADLVVICTPVSQMAPLAKGFGGLLSPGAIVTDVGSAKAAVIAALESEVHAAGGAFIGSHPMAGSERTGVTAAREDLFQGAVSVLTPTSASQPAALRRVTQLWEALGARVLTMTAPRHDEIVARTSHLPHLVAAALAHAILDPGHPPDLAALCATGFRDTTRVASGSPEMWRDIAMANRETILAALDDFGRTLDALRDSLDSGDATALEAFLVAAKERRDAWGEGNASIAGE